MNSPSGTTENAPPPPRDNGLETRASTISGMRPSPPTDKSLEMLGNLLMGAGTIAMLVGTVVNRASSGSIVAASLFSVIVGLAVRFPTLLQDGTMTDDNRPAYSSMRVVVLLVVTSFVMLTVKVGWSTGSLDLLKIDQSWAWVLGVVLGGKVTQSFAEHTSDAPKK